ncbi:MAG: Mur ligase domain-containing protein, partial [Muribaculaceae bacterium]|nr:Mur ligase domain-containing protein [Muribaculaceae bacterium]
MKYSIVEIADILGVDYHSISNEEAAVSQLLTDSRSLSNPEETIFFALKTANNDGHNYIAPLYQKGVRNFVVNRVDNVTREMRDANFLVVPDTLDALQALATSHRRRFNIPVIGITGSRGKTTVKEWLNQLLNDDFKIMRSPRSYNSQIGVPLSLWDIDTNTTLAIIEAGISTTGEMDNLQAMIRPTIGVITNIGCEHNEGFASMDEKAQEKAKILNSCESIVYCADDPLVTATISPLLEVDVAHEYAWSTSDDSRAVVVKDIEKDAKESRITYDFEGNENTITVPFTADSDLENVMTCRVEMQLLS